MLSADPPHPYGGGVRTYHFARALARHVCLDLVVLAEEGIRPLPDDLRDACTAVIRPPRSPRPGRRVPRWRNAVRGLVRVLAPWAVGTADLLLAGSAICAVEEPAAGEGPAHRLYARLLQAEVALGARLLALPPARTMERAEAFAAVLPMIAGRLALDAVDVLWIEHSYLFPLARRVRRLFPRARCVCDAHNVEYVLHSRMAEIATTPRGRRWYRVQSEACRNMERRGYAGCALTFCCSEADRGMILSVSPGAVVEVAPNGADTTHFRPSAAEGQEPRVLFTGGMGYLPNRDAVRRLTREIMPLVWRAYPACRLCVAGVGAGPRFAGLAADEPRIEVASDVEDMRPILDRAWVVAVPLRAGSGTRTKILDAMAMAKPVVSTALGAEGLVVEPGRELLITDDPASFADAVVALLRDQGRRREIGAAARRRVCATYDWTGICSRMVQVFDKCVSSAVGRPVASPSG
jgi:glycosyltransferase involved in cell wall biosynthesis